MGHRCPAAPMQAPRQWFLCWFMTCHLLAMSSEPLGDKTQLWRGIEAAQRPWGGALDPLSALGSCLSIPPSTLMSLPYELCSLPLWTPMTSLPPWTHTACPRTHLLPSSLAAVMAKTSLLHARQGQEMLSDRPSLPGSLEDFPGRVWGRSVPGESSKAQRDAPMLRGTALT